MKLSDWTQFRQQFKIVCAKCGSENITVDEEPVRYGTPETGAYGGGVTAGCNDGKNNDFFADTCPA